MTLPEFEQACIELAPKLKITAFRLTRNEEESKDLVQHAIMQGIKYFRSGKYQHKSKLSALMHTIVRNAFINDYRKRKKFPTIDMEPGNPGFAMPTLARNTGEEEVSKKDIVAIIHEVLDKKYYEPFLLYNDGFSYAELSEKFNVPLGTIKSRIFHARRKLRTDAKLQYLKKITYAS